MVRSTILVASLLVPRAEADALASAPSPFLREHARDAVAWQPWAAEALDRARHEGRPAALVIGRFPSERCRKRLEEAVADPAVREALERRLVPVLADRDERPDLGDAAAVAVALLGESETRLPIVLLLTAEGRPFAGLSLAGPAPLDRLRGALGRALDDWESRRGEVETRAGVQLLALREAQGTASAPGLLDREVVDRARRGLAESFDAKRGGFGRAPKAIPHGPLRLLLGESARGGDPSALRPAVFTLEAMMSGALRDPRTGAFHAEALDDEWRVVVPEATLADNALMLRASVLAGDATGDDRFKDAAAGIAGWALGAMRDPAGGFFAGTGVGVDGTPVTDERVFAGANGLMIGALARSGERLDRPGDLAAARGAAVRVLERLRPDGGLRRFALGGEAGGPAFLEDHAYLGEGLLDLADATREALWRTEAQAVVEAALRRFSDPDGGGFFDADDAHGLALVRTRSGFDGALLSANGVMASVLRRLSAVTGESRYLELARHTVLAFAPELRQAPRGMETMAESAAELLGPRRDDPGASLPIVSREVREGVTLEASVTPSRVGGGGVAEGQVRLVVAEGYHVNAHRPGPKDLVGLTVSVPGDVVAAAPPRYPPPSMRPRRLSPEPVAVHSGDARVTVALRVPAGARPGPVRVKFRVGFQACRGDRCRPPESVLLEALLEVAADPAVRPR